MNPISFTKATESDYDWAFELKVLVEKSYIEAVFGWNYPLQREFHHNDWQEAVPNKILYHGEAIGSYVLQEKDYGYYFGRFFVHPDYQGLGIGKYVLEQVCAKLDREHARADLLVLQGNSIYKLYERYGWQIQKQDEQFIYMSRFPATLTS